MKLKKNKIPHNVLTLHQIFSKKKQPFDLLHWFFFPHKDVKIHQIQKQLMLIAY